jgi:hypothetical protein
MKKLVWVLAFFVVATALKQTYEYFSPMAEAYRAYREEARNVALGRENDPAFRDIEGNIVDVVYRLVSAEPAGDGHVRLVVTEAIHFQRFSESRPFGNRRVAETRRNIVMAKVSGRWTVTELTEDATKVRELSAAVEVEDD